MGSTIIKVIKKSSTQVLTEAKPEKKNLKTFSKNAVSSIEGNIKGWIEELQVRKNDELLQAHTFFGGLG